MHMRCCFNSKFLLAAAAIAAGTWFVAPDAALPVAAVLIALFCPAAMALAIRRTRRGGCNTQTAAEPTSGRDPKLDERIHELRTEINDLRGQHEKK